MATTQQRRLFDDYTPGATCTEAPARLYQAPIVRLKLIRESTTETPVKIRGPQDSYAALRHRFADCDREVLVAMLLDCKNNVLAIDPCFQGTLNSCSVSMREAFKSAMLTGAAAVIFAHNHPTGDPSPSPDDVLTTRELVAAGRVLAIDVLDHIVLGNGRYVSLRERGLGFN